MKVFDPCAPKASAGNDSALQEGSRTIVCDIDELCNAFYASEVLYYWALMKLPM